MARESDRGQEQSQLLRLVLLFAIVVTGCQSRLSQKQVLGKDKVPPTLQMLWSAPYQASETAAFSPDGARVAVYSKQETRVWNVKSGSLVISRSGFPTTLGFFGFTDGETISAGNDGKECGLDDGQVGPCFQSWRLSDNTTHTQKFPTGDFDLDRCWPFHGRRLSVTRPSALPCETQSPPGSQSQTLSGRVVVVSWHPPDVRTSEISVSDFPDWPVPTSGQRRISVEKSVVSPAGRIALLVNLMNEEGSGGWLIHTTALVVLDSELHLLSAKPLAMGIQAAATDMAWTRDGSIILLNDAIFGIGPGRWLAVRVSENGQIENRIAHPGYPDRLSQVYLPVSDRILVVSGNDVAVVAADTGKVIHHVKSEETLPMTLIASEDEHHALSLGFRVAALWELPLDWRLMSCR